MLPNFKLRKPRRNVPRPLKNPSSSIGVTSLRASNPRGRRSSLTDHRRSPHQYLLEKGDEARGKTKQTFYNCMQMHLQSQFVFNAAELQKFYVLCGLKKSLRVAVRQAHDRIHVLNDAIEWLPMKHFSPQATDKTPQCEKFSDADMVANVMRAMPESWQNDLLKSDIRAICLRQLANIAPL
jgi:hypothetical protein